MSLSKPFNGFNASRRALLIDDDKLMLEVLGDKLRDLGIVNISTAVNGAAGITVFDRLTPPPDLVFCDLHMPGSDGFQFMEQLSARNFTGGVVLVSGMDSRTMNSASLMGKFHRLNVLATLNKPVNDAALSAAIGKLG